MKKTGILLMSLLILGGCSSNTTETTETTTTNISSSIQDTLETYTDNDSETNNSGMSSITMTLEEAKTIYDEQFPNSSITSIDVIYKLGKYYYDIEGVDEDNEYEMTIDIAESKIKDKESDDLDRDEKGGIKQQNEAIDFEKIKPLNEIVDIAEGVLDNSIAIEGDLEKELGMDVWELQVSSDVDRMEVKINAATGEILEQDRD